MASSELKGHEAAMEQKGDLSELLEQVKETLGTFHVSKDESESTKKPERWRSRTLERRLLTSEHKMSNIRSTTSADSPQEWQETANLARTMHNILHFKTYKDGDRLSPEDEMKVSSVFQFHPNAEVKTGPGIDYFKIDVIYDEFTRCFWAVRVDCTAVSFSFHKCLKSKLGRESPHLVEQYGSTFTDFKSLDLLQAAARRRGEKLPRAST